LVKSLARITNDDAPCGHAAKIVGDANMAAEPKSTSSDGPDGAMAIARPGARFMLWPSSLSIDQFRAFSLVGVLFLIWIAFQLMTHGIFLSPRNLTTLTLQSAITAMLAAGTVLIIVPGYIDLSIGSATAFIGVLAAMLVDPNRGWALTNNPAIVIAVTILAGMVLGTWQGFWVAWMGVPSFVVTLASLLALRGAAYTITGGSTVSHNDILSFLAADFVPGSWTAVGMFFLVAVYVAIKYIDWKARAAIAAKPTGFLTSAGIPIAVTLVFAIGVSAVSFSYRGMPMPVAILGVVLAVITFVMARTVFGRRLYAIGGNPSAARYAGISAKWHCFFVFLIMGALYGLAGIMLDARMGLAVPSAAVGLELNVIASAVIGGTSLFGGLGTAVGAVIGALLLESLNNGMGIMNIETSFQQIVDGLVLLVAVYLDMRNRRRMV
jgi:ABC-type xylose transport system permease subunit